MVTIGADLHKRSHTVVAVDEQGRKLAETHGRGDPGRAPRAAALGRATGPGAPLGARGLPPPLPAPRSATSSRAGESVVRVPPKLMAGARRSAREPGKSDPIDALAVARAALREPDLPVARLDGPEREVRLLVDHRDDLVAERTAGPEPPALAPPRAQPGRRARRPAASTDGTSSTALEDRLARARPGPWRRHRRATSSSASGS